jgi:transcriptional regulator with XRE-family HTH domain
MPGLMMPDSTDNKRSGLQAVGGTDLPDDGMTDIYNQSVGRRLRAIRKQKGLSLQDVEAVSEQEFKASVLGAYERGERSLSLPRMQRLAGFYGVPIDQLLPPDDAQPSRGISWSSGGIRMDLNRLEEMHTSSADLLERFLRAIQLMRQDFNGRVLTIRRADLQLLSGFLSDSDGALNDVLVELGLADGGTT